MKSERFYDQDGDVFKSKVLRRDNVWTKESSYDLISRDISDRLLAIAVDRGGLHRERRKVLPQKEPERGKYTSNPHHSLLDFRDGSGTFACLVRVLMCRGRCTPGTARVAC